MSDIVGLAEIVLWTADKTQSVRFYRDLLGLPKDKRIILFGAVRGTTDPNKGFHLLKPALQALGKASSDMLALLFGDSGRDGIPDLGMPAVSLGSIHDEHKLATIYSSADVFVAPSLQESFCQTAAEALACGTPVVAFGATGLLDVVEHLGCGYLAQPYDIEDLARGIGWVLEDRDRYAELSSRARLKIMTEFDIAEASKSYIRLYRELLQKTASEA